MRQVLGDTLRGLGVSDDSVTDILLAATEACSNVVLHAGPGSAFDVMATVDPEGCRVEVRDDGAGCHDSQVNEGELEEHGRGFAIMRGCMDGVTLRSAPGRGTSVVLDKRIDWDVPVPVPA